MNFPAFIATRIRKPASDSFSATVYKIGVISIAAGIAVTILAFMILFGFKENIVNRLFSLSPQLKISKYTLGDSYDESAISKQAKIYSYWKNISEVAHLQATAQKSGILKSKDDIHGVLLKGIGSDFNWPMLQGQIKAGRKLAFKNSGYSTEVIISQTIASKLALQIGDEPIIYFVQQSPKARKLKIVGIYETNLEEFDNQIIIGDIALIQRINNWPADSVGAFEVYLHNFENMKPAQEALIKNMEPDLKLENAKQKFLPIFDWLTMLDRNMILFVSILFIVVCFNIIAVLLVLILERIPTIGVLKALGSSDWSIRKIFMNLSLYMVLIGLFWGNVLGLLLCFLQWKFRLIPLDASNYFISYVPIAWHWHVVLFINLVTVLLIVSVLILPTYFIQKISPTKAIVFGK